MALTTAVGQMASGSKKKRMQVFGELYEFNEQLILNLKYNRLSLKKIAEHYKFVGKIIDGEKVLGGEDGAFISEYTENLGKTDASSQIDYLNGRGVLLKKYKEESYEDYKKYSKLYVKIFFLTGVLIAVLLA